MLTVLLAILLVVLAVLAIPVELHYRVNWHGRMQGDMRLVWLFGLLRVRIPTTSTQSAASARKTHTHHPRHRKTKSKRKSNPLAAWRLRSFRQRLIKFVHDLWRAMHKRDVRLHLLIGLDDPADTGQLWAVMGPLSAILAQCREVHIDIEPDFTDTRFEFNSSGNIRVIPLQLLALIFALLLSPPFWHGVQQMRKAG